MNEFAYDPPTGLKDTTFIPLNKTTELRTPIQLMLDQAKGYINDMQKVIDVTMPPYNAKGGGTIDDSTAIQAALNGGAKIVTGSGKTYKVNSSITIPEYVELLEINLVAGTPGMSVVLMSNKSKFRGKIVGTGTTNIAERGIYPATDGVSDVEIDADISNLTIGIQVQPTVTTNPKRWKINAYIHDIVGQTGVSEGYGALLSPAESCTGKIYFYNIKRHALYLSAGAKYNNFYVDIDTCYNAAIQLYSTAAQPAVEFNTIKGIARNLSNAATVTLQSYGCILSQKCDHNTISLDIVSTGLTDTAISLEGKQDTGGPYPYKNNIINCNIKGQYLGDVIKDQNADSTVIKDNNIYAYGVVAVIALRTAGTITAPKHGAYVDGNVIDAQGQSIKGIFDGVTNAVTHIGENHVSNNGSGSRVDVTTVAAIRTGNSREYSGTKLFSNVPATSSSNAAITLPDNIQAAKLLVSVSNQVPSEVNAICYADNVTSTGFTLYVYNPHSSAQDITVSWLCKGD